MYFNVVIAEDAGIFFYLFHASGDCILSERQFKSSLNLVSQSEDIGNRRSCVIGWSTGCRQQRKKVSEKLRLSS